MKTDSSILVSPVRSVRGSVSLPGDKSISHRYAILAAIAEGPSRLENYSTGCYLVELSLYDNSRKVFKVINTEVGK